MTLNNENNTDYLKIAQRPNFFAGQYLLEDDFEDLHNYHDAQQRLHHRFLHVSGIIEGLVVTVPVAGQRKVKVSAGTAIDPQGNVIVLTEEREVNLISSSNSGELYITFKESEIKQQEDSNPITFTRYLSAPEIAFAESRPAGSVTLATLTISGNTVTPDPRSRQMSGVLLPSPGGRLSLRYQGNHQAPGEHVLETALLAGHLSVRGDLSVTGNSTLAGTLKLETGIGTTTPKIHLAIGDDDTGLKQEGEGKLAIYTNNVERMRIVENGNVGIGTTSPVAKLDIQTANRTGTHPTTVKGLYITGDFAADSGGVEFRKSDASEGIGFGTNTIYAAGSSTNQNLNLKAKGTGTVSIESNLSATKDLTVTGNSTLTGRVGIGGSPGTEQLKVTGSATFAGTLSTTGPNGNLTVTGISTLNGNTTIAGALSTTGTNGNLTVAGTSTLNGNTTIAGALSTTGTNGNLTVAGTSTLNGSLTVNNTISLKGSLSATGLTVNASGNVGIGTTNPSERLEIQRTGTGSDALNFLSIYNDRIDSNTQDNRIVWKYGANRTTAAAIASRPNSALTAGDLRFQTGSPLSDRMIVTETGNVGIGTTTPNARLEVNGTIQTTSLSVIGSQTAGTAGTAGTAAAVTINPTLAANANNNILSAVVIKPTFTTGSFTGVSQNGLIVEQGNVGIKTNTPKIDLAIGHENTGLKYESPNNQLAIWTNGSERLRINGNGNVGIGTTTPSELLEIQKAGSSNFLSIYNSGTEANQESRIVWKNGATRTNAAAIASRPGAAFNTGVLRLQTAKNGTLEDRIVLNESGVYENRNPSGYDNYEIYIRGSATDSSEGNTPFLSIKGHQVTQLTAQQGINTVILNPDGSYKAARNHDVFGVLAQWDSWATWVSQNSREGDVIAVASCTMIQRPNSGSSGEKFLRSILAVSAFSLFQTTATDKTALPYVLLFIMGRSNSIEVLQPYRGSNAHIRTTYYDLLRERSSGDKLRMISSANDVVDVTSSSWVDMSKMVLSFYTENSDVLIFFKAGGVQCNEKQFVRAQFQLLVDNKPKAYTSHEFNNKGWELRDVTLNALVHFTSGNHTIKVQWFGTGSDLSTPSSMEATKVRACWYEETRSLIAVEL